MVWENMVCIGKHDSPNNVPSVRHVCLVVKICRLKIIKKIMFCQKLYEICVYVE